MSLILIQVVGLIIHSFSRQSSILFQDCRVVYLTTHLLKCIWVVFNFELLHIKLLQTLVYGFLCGCKFLFLWGYYIVMLKWDYLVVYGMCALNLRRNCQTIFQSGHTLLHSHQQYRIPVAYHILTST